MRLTLRKTKLWVYSQCEVIIGWVGDGREAGANGEVWEES